MINTRQQNLGQMLISTIAHYAMYMVAMRLWRGVANSISDCVNYTKDLNQAMTNIRVVTMDTREATEALLEDYNKMGQELGASTTDIAEGAVDWLRQGYSQGETTELVKDSTILSRLALLDNAEATEYLTSALKGYKLEAQDAIGVIDQLVSIDLEAATSAGDMAEAMSRTANMARTTGFKMNELLGMIATMSEVTQNSASTIGNSVKTILSRMSNVKAGLDDFEGEALNDVEKTLNRVGIALRDNQGNWYDFYDVLDEIASKWDNFSDVQQSQITTALGGKQKPSAVTYSNVWCLAV
jgi:TP901 family phage tail tape measure protein